ncbi:MAG TPA: adenylate/guanylate cyclase domain-containing protein [Gaiella sp.]|nr:adenylate/guanylate cyclase domain-containing protein [Gaiella sp.]
MTCPRCGSEGAAGRFCSECGAPLEGAGAAPQSEERKVVSVLFCDLVGFTAASERADPEDVRARIRPYHAALRHELERYGGTVEKFIGDAVMAVFGAPVSHEDDPERAVRAALAILETIGELNARDPRLALQVRIGIDTGEAVVALDARPEHGEGMVAGDVVNTAARIQSAAPVDGIAVSYETYRQTERVMLYDELPPAEVKGKSEPLRLYRATGARGRFGTDLIRTHGTPFVGREVEKTLLQGLFDRCVRDSAVQLVTLVGEPGVGKSRLCAELFRHVDERAELIVWRQGRCLPYGEGITFWALGEIVKAHAGIFESDPAEVARGKLAAVLPDGPDHEWLGARLLPLLGVDAGQPATREESFEAWRRFVEGIAADGPAVVVVEDLHWADTALLDFLSYLGEWAVGVPLLLLCTARPELHEAHSTWGAGMRNAHTINLEPLSERETSELVHGLLARSVSEPVRDAILERAGGNPLYAEEFVRLVADRGLDGGEDALAFPDSVQALIAARLDTLQPERKSLLQDASVLGKVFWTGALAAMSGIGVREVELALHELARKELVRPARSSSMEGEAEYAFWHVLVRDVAYGQIPRAARARRHRAAAAWIETQAGDRVEDLADVLAHHYSEALELARAGGDDALADELVPEARRALGLAGSRAASLDAAAAGGFYRRALELFEPDDHSQAPVLLEAARVNATLSSVTAEEQATRAADLFRAAGDDLGAAEALLDLSRYAGYRGSHADVRASIAEAERLLERHPPGRVHALLLVRKAGQAMMAGQAAECVDTADKAIEVAERLGDPILGARSLQYRGVARTELGDMGGFEDIDESIARSRRGQPALDTGIGMLNRADATWMWIGAQQGLERHLETQAFDDAHGLRGAWMWSRGESTWMLFDLGRWDEVIAVTDELAAIDDSVGSVMPKILGFPYRVLVREHRGEAAAAGAELDGMLPRAREADDAQLLLPTVAVAAIVVAGRGDSDAAIGFVREYHENTRSRSDRHRALFLPELTRVAAAAGALGLAGELAEGLRVDLGRIGCARVAAAAILAEAESRTDEAVDLYRLAAERWSAFGSVPGRADALLGLVRCRVALGHGADGPELDEARGAFAALGHVAGVAEADELLARV